MKKQITIVFLSILFTIFFLEIGLRIYNPVRATVSGNKIKLETNVIRTIRNPVLTCFEKVIFHKVNSIGFRGEEPPEDFSSYFSLVTVGGSTTHSFYNAEGTTWTDYLGKKLKGNFDARIWINNAGLDGHSTFGHIMLVDDYISRLKPDMIIFLIGVNDIGRLKMEDGVVGENTGVSKIQHRKNAHLFINLINNMALDSDLISTLLNLYRLQQASNIVEGQWNVGHRMIDVAKVKTISEVAGKDRPMPPYLGEKYLQAYADRIKKLISLCRQYNIIPVFLSSPALFGDAIDPKTSVDLGKVITQDLFELSGSDTWKLLDGYNRVVEKVCRDEQIPFIDLGRKMPKDSNYFYDWLHFTTNGSQKVAEIIYADLVKFLPNNIKEKVRTNNTRPIDLQQGIQDGESQQAIRKMWELAPDNPDLCFQMGTIWEEEGKIKEAVRLYRKSLSAQHLYVKSQTRLARIYSREGDYDKAIQAYMAIIRQKPDIAGLYYNIACLYAKQNRKTAAMQWLKMGINRGYDNWNLIQTDRDLDNIRHLPEYKDLIGNRQ